jgi:hypothetical protein
MTILLVGTPVGDLNQVRNDLLRICPDPGLTFSVIPSFTIDARQVVYSQSISSVGCNLVAQLAGSSADVLIVAKTGALAIPTATDTNLVLSQRAGFTVFDSLPSASVNIGYDGQGGAGCNGRGYWVEGTTNGTSAEIDYPTDVILFHELVNARNLIGNSFSSGLASAAADAIAAENQYRAQRNPVLPLRTGIAGGCKAGPPQQPGGNNGNVGKGGTRSGCFVATAALEAEHYEKLEFLRAFRDEILTSTRRGTEYFDAFYSYYYQVSPAIANFLREHDDFRHSTLTAFVLPLVNYLKLSLTYPATDIPDELPDEWKAFLRVVRDDLEAWGRLALPPLESFPTDYTRKEIVDDINFVKQYVLRSSESREAYQAMLDHSGSANSKTIAESDPCSCGKLEE